MATVMLVGTLFDDLLKVADSGYIRTKESLRSLIYGCDFAADEWRN